MDNKIAITTKLGAADADRFTQYDLSGFTKLMSEYLGCQHVALINFNDLSAETAKEFIDKKIAERSQDTNFFGRKLKYLFVFINMPADIARDNGVKCINYEKIFYEGPRGIFNVAL